MHGFNNELPFAKCLAETADVICLREYWLHAECLNAFNVFTEFTSMTLAP